MPQVTNISLKHHYKEIYQSLFKYHPHSIFVMDKNGYYVDVNRSFEKMSGYTLKELETMTYQDIVLRENIQQTEEYFAKSLCGIPQKFSNAIYQKNGNLVQTAVTLVPITVQDEVIGIYGLIRNITSRKRMEEALILSEKRLVQAQQIARLGSWEWDVTNDKEYWSEEVCNILGIKDFPLNVITNDTFASYVHKNDLPLFERSIQEAVGGKPYDIEFRIVRGDGEVRIVHELAEMEIDNNGKIIRLFGTTQDITERKQKEAALLEAETKYRSLIEKAMVGVFLSDKGYLNYVNPRFAEIFGYKQDELLYVDGMDLCHPDDRLIFKEERRKLYSLGSVNPIELRGIKKDGSIIYIELHGSLTMINGKPSIIGTLIDITKRKKAEQLLQKSEKLAVLGQLAAGIGHEIRNPLTTLKGFIQLLQTKVSGYDEYFTIMMAELNRINSIVSEFMYLAKPQATNLQSITIKKLIDDILPLVEGEAAMNRVQIFTWIEPNLPVIACEEKQIKQVFINMLKNAIEAMPDGGKVMIGVQKIGQHLVISFSDEGCGIPEERILKLGEPFYTTKKKGTGLGLMVSHKIIENHTGRIEIHSQVGIGTTIDVILPLEM